MDVRDDFEKAPFVLETLSAVHGTTEMTESTLQHEVIIDTMVGKLEESCTDVPAEAN